MASTSVPPQAYTKSELAKAYQWLIEQTPEIKGLASSPDSLMSLYRRAQIYGTSSIIPAESKSSTEFKNELKDLATQLGSFGKADIQNSNTEYSSSVKYNSTKTMPPWVQSSQTQGETRSQRQTNDEEQNQSTISVQREFKSQARNLIEEAKTQSAQALIESYETQRPKLPMEIEHRIEPKLFNALEDLDPNSRAMIQEIRRKLNLSSDKEALRMMISISYERLKNLF